MNGKFPYSQIFESINLIVFILFSSREIITKKKKNLVYEIDGKFRYSKYIIKIKSIASYLWYMVREIFKITVKSI